MWASIAACTGDGMSVLLYPSADEQGFELRTAGTRRRHPIDFDGMTPVAFQPTRKETLDAVRQFHARGGLCGWVVSG
ncbi:type I-E CRISPR-associated endoribonuclease Cas2 [Streptomyces sp. NPDC091209]|uniref:type I-E CRISPR-associated endoribonuclease Cas2 n=1 Tax=Streptomyces sp. NPDC091209 TaxID=3365974 RepID=UPI0037FB2427